MCQSIALMYQQGGWIDRWPQINDYTNVMCGSPLTTCAATAWMDGLHGFDMKLAWQGMYKDATQAPHPASLMPAKATSTGSIKFILIRTIMMVMDLFRRFRKIA